MNYFSPLRSRKLIAVLVAFATIFNLQAGENLYDLEFKTETYNAPANFQQLLNEGLPTDAAVHGSRAYMLMQFFQVPTQDALDRLDELDIRVIDIMPQRALMVDMPAKLDLSLLTGIQLRGIHSYRAEWKLHPFLHSGYIPDYAVEGSKTKVSVIIQDGLSPADQLQLLNEAGLELIEVFEDHGEISGKIPTYLLADLADEPYVKYVEPIQAPAIPEDWDGRGLHRNNTIDVEFPWGTKWDGTGVSILVRDDGIVGPHIDFEGRLFNLATGTSAVEHGDMVAGIFGGAGNLDPFNRGMAAGSDVYVVDYRANFYSGQTLGLHTGPEKVVVTNSSYSDGCNNGYTNNARRVDEQMYDNPTLLHVFSAGNNGNSPCGNAYISGSNWGTITGGHKQSKNSISVANLDYVGVVDGSSSRGPATDGRIKPEIASNGRNQISTDPNNQYSPGGGTSAAAPSIAGVAAQLYHAYQDSNSGSTPEAALIKAILLNGADDIGNTGPDYYYGYGRVNARRSARMIEERMFQSGTISQGGSDTIGITVPANVGQLKAMLIWSDPEASTGANTALINDLDFQLLDLTNTLYEPWVLSPGPSQNDVTALAVRGTDNLNPQEQVTLDFPSAGVHDLVINGSSVVGSQKYWVVWDFVYDEITVTYPIGGEGFISGSREALRWDALGDTGTFTIEYSIDSGASWSPAGTAAGNRRYSIWNPIAPATDKALVRVSRGTRSDVSDYPFSIIGTPNNIRETNVCPDSREISWNAVNGATSYDVFVLGNKFMDSMATTTGTSVDVMGLVPQEDYWVAVRANAGSASKGRRSEAVFIPSNLDLSNCPSLVNELQISEITSLAAGDRYSCHGLSGLPVAITVQNNSSSNESNVAVYYSLNGGAAISGTIPSVTAGGSANYTFPTNLTLGSGINTLRVWHSLATDQYRFNDTLEIDINVISSSAVGLPLIQDFESFLNCGTQSDCGATICALGSTWRNVDNGSGDDHDWRVNSGAPPTRANGFATGPSDDHTTNGFNYVYLEASGGCTFAEAYLVSPCIDLNGVPDAQLSFWYHMYGGDMGDLYVDIFDGSSWTLGVSSISGNQGDSWEERVVDLASYVNKTINIRFRGVTGNDWGSDMALDDIQVTAGNIGPAADFTVGGSQCLGANSTFSFSGTGSGLTYTWNFGFGANPATANGVGPHTVTYNTTGIKAPSLIIDNGSVSDTMAKIIEVGIEPTASFTTFTNGATISFINNSLNASTYFWNFADGTTSTDEAPSKVYSTPGFYDVMLVASSSCASDTFYSQLNVTVVGISSVNDLEGVSIYPNPTGGMLYIEMDNPNFANASLQMTDMLGKQVVVERKLENAQGRITIDARHLAKGAYMLQLKAEENVAVERIIIQ